MGWEGWGGRRRWRWQLCACSSLRRAAARLVSCPPAATGSRSPPPACPHAPCLPSLPAVVPGNPLDDVKLLVETVGSLLRSNALRSAASKGVNVSFGSKSNEEKLQSVA